MENANLKYCPFCSSSSLSISCAGHWFIHCFGCKAVVHFGVVNKDEITLKWNIHTQTSEECLDNAKKAKNERGAGRKPKLNDADRKRLLFLYKSGQTYRQLSEDFMISVGTVHKIINEHRK